MVWVFFFLAVTTSLTQEDVLLTKQTSSSVSGGDGVSKMFFTELLINYSRTLKC